MAPISALYRPLVSLSAMPAGDASRGLAQLSDDQLVVVYRDLATRAPSPLLTIVVSLLAARGLIDDPDPRPLSPPQREADEYAALMTAASARAAYRGVIERDRFIVAATGPSLRAGNPLSQALALSRGVTAWEATATDEQVRFARALQELAVERSPRAPAAYLERMLATEAQLERVVAWSQRHGLGDSVPTIRAR